MIRRPPRSTRTDTLFPHTTLFRSHPHRNVVTQALGVTDPQNLNVETLSGDLLPGMQLLLCSDGLTEEVDDRGISQVLAHTECSAQECVDGLVAAALDGGGSDNVTVVLVRRHRSEEHTSELQSLMRISYAVFCLKKQNTERIQNT